MSSSNLLASIAIRKKNGNFDANAALILRQTLFIIAFKMVVHFIALQKET